MKVVHIREPSQRHAIDSMLYIVAVKTLNLPMNHERNRRRDTV